MSVSLKLAQYLGNALLGLIIIRIDIAWLYSLRFLTKGPQLLAQQYKTGVPYSVRTPQSRYVLLSSSNHVKELSNASGDQLSLVEFFSDMFHMPHTMNSIQLNQAASHHRVLKRFTQAVPRISEKFESLIQKTLFRHLKSSQINNDWIDVSAYPLAEALVGQVNFHSFFGDSYGDSGSFLKSAHQWVIDIFVASEILHYTPRLIAPLLTWLVTRGQHSLKALRRALIPVVKEGICHFNDQKKERPLFYIDCLLAHYRAQKDQLVSDIVQQCLAVWLASMHQPAMTLTYTLYDLCLHSEYLEPLRQEVDNNWTEGGCLLEKMPLLDSFIKESSRLNGSETTSLRRKAMSRFTFSNGVEIASGDVVCVPLQAMGRDSTYFSDPDTFDGFRFVAKGENKGRDFTELNPAYPYWGYGKTACPGRFYTAVVLKTILAHLLRTHEFKLADEKASRTFSWRATRIPRPSVKLLMRSR